MLCYNIQRVCLWQCSCHVVSCWWSSIRAQKTLNRNIYFENPPSVVQRGFLIHFNAESGGRERNCSAEAAGCSLSLGEQRSQCNPGRSQYSQSKYRPQWPESDWRSGLTVQLHKGILRRGTETWSACCCVWMWEQSLQSFVLAAKLNSVVTCECHKMAVASFEAPYWNCASQWDLSTTRPCTTLTLANSS